LVIDVNILVINVNILVINIVNKYY